MKTLRHGRSAFVEPADAKELISEAIEEVERAEHADRAVEKKFRDRVSILVGIFAVLLAMIHVARESSSRESVLKTVEASDTYNYMEAKIIRESLLKSLAETPGLAAEAKEEMLKEAARLRNPDKAGHGIVQLQRRADELRDESARSTRMDEWYELAESALQVGIVLLSIALVARSAVIVTGALSLAALGVLIAAATAVGLFA